MSLRNLLQRVDQLNWKNLRNNDFHFSSTKEILKAVEEAIRAAIDLHKNGKLGEQFSHELEKGLNELLPVLENIRDYEKSSSADQKTIEKNLKKKLTYWIRTLYHYIDFSFGKVSLKNKLSKLEKSIKSAKEKVRESEDFVLNIERQKYGNFFGDQADKNKIKAYIYLGLSVMGVIAIIILTIVFFGNEKLQEIKFSNTGIFLQKAFIITAIGYLVGKFSKLHKAEEHLATINRSKQNAINSFWKFYDSVENAQNDSETRNEILLQLTKAIFTTPESGYLKEGKEKFGSVNQILDLGKRLKD